jgi:hypothetical protein
MRQGGLDLDRRGPEFERYCRENLNSAAKESPIRDSIQIIDKAVEFKPPSERSEEIDIVVIIESWVLLIEAKCILWPDDAIQFANYRDTVEKAAAQIARKREAVSRNYPAFASRLKVLGYKAPKECNVVCCVLTNSAVFSGFPVQQIPIVDLSIISGFFKNKHTKFAIEKAGKVIEKYDINFYSNAGEAGKCLEGYLARPPQLDEAKASIKKRELIFPIRHSEFGQFVQEGIRVEINTEEVIKRHSELIPT